MSKTWWMAVGTVLWMVPLGACEQSAARSSQCESICEKREFCDSSTDEMDCVDDCLSETHLSDNFLSQWAACVVPNEVSCDKAMNDAAVDDCVTDALRSEEPSELLRDVCQGLSTKLAACQQADALRVQKQCERGDSLKLSDDFLQQSRECVDDLCEQMAECFDDLSDDHDTDLSILPASEVESVEVPEAASDADSEEPAGEMLDGDASAYDGDAGA